jgi:hypothetical protein
VSVRKRQTISEQLFEKYLAERGLEFRYEEAPPGIRRPADYTVEISSVTIRIDVKEWKPTEPSPGFGMLDPYEPVRQKIKACQRKFQEYKGRGEPCVMVACHHGPQLIMLSDWAVYGGMLGNLGWSFPIATQPNARLPPGRQVFTGGGSMVHRPPKGRPVTRNTTISSIAVLKALDLRERRVRLEIKRQELAAARPWTTEERWNVVSSTLEAAGPQEVKLRLVVYDNPVGALWPPPAFPNGPIDERYGLEGDRLRRMFIGSQLAELEKAERALGITQEDPLGLRR